MANKFYAVYDYTTKWVNADTDEKYHEVTDTRTAIVLADSIADVEKWINDQVEFTDTVKIKYISTDMPTDELKIKRAFVFDEYFKIYKTTPYNKYPRFA